MKASLFAMTLLSAVLAPGVFASSLEEMPGVALKPVRIALFKNGFGFVSMEGKMPGAKRMELTNLPIPSFGTFWLSAPPSEEILKLSSSAVKVKEKMADGDFYDLASSNMGAEVTIGMKPQVGEKATLFSGKILSVSSVPEQSRPNMIGQTSSPSAMGGSRDGEKLIYLRLQSSEYKGAEAKETVAVISAQNIASMEFAGKMPFSPQREVEKQRICLELKAPSSETLKADCLAKGIAWTPEYRMDLSDPEQAVFSAQATVMNELMDMEHVELKLISGYPSLKFADVGSPVAGGYGNVWEFLNMIYPSENGRLRRMGGGMSSNAYNKQDMSFAEGAVASSFAPEAVEQAEDLFFYPVKNFSCKYGETVMIPLFSGKVPYKHVYVWNIPEQNQIDQWDRQAENGQPASGDTSYDVWHCIRFTNLFSLPLTKGALEFTSKGNLVGQGMINFISPGQESTVTLNKSLQISVKRTEKTLSSVKKTEGINIYGKVRMESTIEGTLTMRNYSDKPIKMEISKKIQGTPSSASNEGIFSFVPNENSLNPNGLFKWTVDVAPGETKTLTYQYKYLR